VDPPRSVRGDRIDGRRSDLASHRPVAAAVYRSEPDGGRTRTGDSGWTSSDLRATIDKEGHPAPLDEQRKEAPQVPKRSRNTGQQTHGGWLVWVYQDGPDRWRPVGRPRDRHEAIRLAANMRVAYGQGVSVRRVDAPPPT
jgi:hypothetical protein